MLPIDTLRRSLLVVLPVAALAVGCVRGDGTEESTADPPPPLGAGEDEDEGSGPIGEARLEEGEIVAPVVDDGAADENGPNDAIALGPDGNVPLDELPSNGEPGAQRTGRTEGQDDGWTETLAAELFAALPADPAARAFGGLGASRDALTTPRRETVWREARRNTIELKKSTSYYSHTTYINEKTDTRRADCSGYIGYVLQRTYKSAYDAIPTPTTVRALSKDFYDYLVKRPASATSSRPSSPRWRRMNYVRNLRPGDVLVWRNPSGYRNTGHTMIVRDYPRKGRTSRNELLVPVYDSTASRHDYKGVWDSRTSGWHTGIGAGTVGIKVDAAGRPIAYYWTGGASKTAVYRKIAMGRIE